MVQMVNLKIFKDAADIYEAGDVQLKDSTSKVLIFMIKEDSVRFEITPEGTVFKCSCKHHSVYGNNSLCKRVIAGMYYIYQNHGRFKVKKDGP